MKTTPQANDVLRDIEFELLQGIVSREKLGQGIRALRNHQSLLRRTLLEPTASVPDARDLATRQLQLNDMLITLLQEMVTATESLEEKIKRFNRWPSAVPVAEIEAEIPAAQLTVQAQNLPARSGETLSSTTTPDRLAVDMVLAPVPIPLIGGVIRRLQKLLHGIVLFYVRRLAEKQGAVNSVHAAWLSAQERTIRSQAAEIEQLKQMVVTLQTRLSRLEPPTGAESEP